MLKISKREYKIDTGNTFLGAVLVGEGSLEQCWWVKGVWGGKAAIRKGEGVGGTRWP